MSRCAPGALPSDDRATWDNPNATCDGDEPWHGRNTGYANHGCREPACAEAHRSYLRHFNAANPEPYQRQRARERAMRRLARKYSLELETLIEIELARLNKSDAA